MFVLFAAVSGLMISAIPDAAAMMTPSLSKQPGTPVIGGSMQVLVNAGAMGDLDHVKGKIRVYEPGKNPAYDNGQFFPLQCMFGTSNVAAGVNGDGYVPGNARVWEFRQFSNQAVANEYVITSTTDQLKVRFGVNGATLTVPNGGIVKTAGVTLDENSGVWVLVEGVGLPGDTIDHFAVSIANGGVGGPYNMATCGFDNNGAAGSTSQYGIFAPFETTFAVGGSIIPIDTTALFVTGVLSSPLMVLPVLGAIAGTAIVLLKLQVRRTVS